jgi:NAD(P)-dependent dehydrogenase (short-subunit alcohol dehydrogenase family)
MMATTPVWLITAAASGFGRYIALEALKRGHKVVATARRPEKLSALKDQGAATVALDVTADEAALDKSLAEAAAAYGRITHVVNAAGYLLQGAVEEVSAAEVRAEFETNVVGIVNVTRAAAPYLREAARRGEKPTIAHFGSVGSWTSTPACVTYCSTKWAASGMGEGVRAELADFGIAGTVIEPGYFRTGFLNVGGEGDGGLHRAVAARELGDVYGADSAVGKARAMLNGANNNQPGDVEKGARVIVDILTGTGVAEGREVPLRIVLGTDALKGIREKLAETEKLLKAWEAVFSSTDGNW